MTTNDLVTGREAGCAAMVLFLARELRATADLWLNLQMTWDLWHARKALRARGKL